MNARTKLAEAASKNAKQHQKGLDVQGLTSTEPRAMEMYREVLVESIDPNPYQPRKVFNEAKLQELAESLQESGLIEPVILRKVDDRYQLIAGERRWRAHKFNGALKIRALVRIATDEDMALLAIIENKQREDLTDYETAMSLNHALQFNKSKTALAKRLGMVRSDLYRYLSFNDLPKAIVDELDKDPSLLGRAMADQLVQLFNKVKADAVSQDRIDEALTDHLPVLVGGLMSQSDFFNALHRDLGSKKSGAKNGEDGQHPSPNGEYSSNLSAGNGKKIGVLKVNSHSASFKIKRQLNKDETKRLEEVVKQFIASLEESVES